MNYIEDLRAVVGRAEPLLRGIAEDDAARRPAPEKWSPKEVIGHLIDSACNNHARIVRAQFQDDLVFPGYAQDHWVESQDYRGESWHNLVTLWHAYNLHMAHLMAAVPEGERFRSRDRHRLDEIGWQPVAADEPTTLDHLMSDYVAHLRHHLLSILPPL